MSPLDRKLGRDLARMWAQAVSIALVVAAAVATFVSLGGVHASLKGAVDRFYESNRFADVFGRCKRAPESVRGELAALPGVRAVTSRVVLFGQLLLEGAPEPAAAQVVSQPEGLAALHTLHLRGGRLAERAGEVVLQEGFALAQGIEVGALLPLVLHGKRLEARVVGIALSPEFVLAMPPGDAFPDPKRFAVLWMPRADLAPLAELDGAFNDVLVKLEATADERDVVAAIDRVLDRWGGGKASGRRKQISHAALQAKLDSLEKNTRVVPTLFFAVAAFLLNIVLGRTIELERQEIATLRSLGRSGLDVALHYLKLVAVVGVLGGAVGVVVGGSLGGALVGLYGKFFRFPELSLELDVGVVAGAVVGSVLASALGALRSLRAIARLQPAEAMRPAAPARYGKGVLEWLGVGALLSPSGRIVLREVSRRPLRTALSGLAIALATALLVTARFTLDATELFMSVLFEQAQRDDVEVMFVSPRPPRAIRALAHVPGVVHAEGMRVSAVRFRAGAGFRDGAIFAFEPGGRLRRPVGWPEGPQAVPEQGLVVSRKLAEALGVSLGGTLRVESLSGERRMADAPVVGLVGDLFGLNAYAGDRYLGDLLGEPELLDGAALELESGREADVLRELRRLPAVSSVAVKNRRLDGVLAETEQTTGVSVTILTAFGAIIAVGVLYNNARVALSTRARELASLRVLGFTLREVTSILLGELAVQTALGLPLGLVVGRLFVEGIASSVDAELYRLPTAVFPETYAFAAFVTLLSALVSAYLVTRRLGELDMIEALKSHG